MHTAQIVIDNPYLKIKMEIEVKYFCSTSDSRGEAGGAFSSIN